MSLRASPKSSSTDTSCWKEHPCSAASLQQTESAVTPLAKTASVPTSPSQTFDTFLGNSKHGAILLALHELAARRSGTSPIVLCGETGTGKTHLLHSVHAELSRHADRIPVLLNPLSPDLSSVQHIMSNAGFLLDDAHLIANTSLQERLCMIFDTASRAQAPMLIAGTGPFFAWPLIPPLRSRLRMGLILSLPEPDLDIRLRFLQRQASAEGMNISRETALILARQCTDLRRLSGTLRHIALYRRLSGADTSTLDVNRIFLGKQQEIVSYQTVVEHVGSQTGVDPKDILGTSRRPEHVFARQLSMFLCREILGLSYPVLGHLFGGKNHSTVIHSCKKIHILRISDKDTNNLVTELTKLCRKEQLFPLNT